MSDIKDTTRALTTEQGLETTKIQLLQDFTQVLDLINHDSGISNQRSLLKITQECIEFHILHPNLNTLSEMKDLLNNNFNLDGTNILEQLENQHTNDQALKNLMNWFSAGFDNLGQVVNTGAYLIALSALTIAAANSSPGLEYFVLPMAFALLYGTVELSDKLRKGVHGREIRLALYQELFKIVTEA